MVPSAPAPALKRWRRTRAAHPLRAPALCEPPHPTPKLALTGTAWSDTMFLARSTTTGRPITSRYVYWVSRVGPPARGRSVLATGLEAPSGSTTCGGWVGWGEGVGGWRVGWDGGGGEGGGGGVAAVSAERKKRPCGDQGTTLGGTSGSSTAGSHGDRRSRAWEGVQGRIAANAVPQAGRS